MENENQTVVAEVTESNEPTVSAEYDQADDRRGMIYVFAVALGNIAMQIIGAVWNVIGGYGIGGSIIPLIISAVVALFLLTGMQWVRYLFIANSALNIVNTFISLIFIINDYSISVPLLVLNSIFFAFYVFSFVVLLVNKSVKAYFENE